METAQDKVIEVSLANFMFICKGLPDPDIWVREIGKTIKNGIDDTTNFYCSQGGVEFGFKIRHVNEWAVEWRPIQKILISNSDEESLKPCKLIFAKHEDGTYLSKDEIDAYNKEQLELYNRKNEK